MRFDETPAPIILIGMGKPGKHYHYSECGMDNVYLLSGFEFVEAFGGRRQVIIHDIDGLHRAIGNQLVHCRKRLTRFEFRFLRHELLISQAALADLLGVGEQTVQRWEAGKSKIPASAESLLRLLYMGDSGGKPNIRKILKRVADLEDDTGDGLNFVEEGDDWRVAA